MVPNFKQLLEIAPEIYGTMYEKSNFHPEDMSVVFYTDHDNLQKLNSEFFYRTGKGKDGSKPRMVEEINVKLNNIRFKYKERKDEETEK